MTVPPQDRRPALRPPQFRLATLFWLVAFLCAVLAAMQWVGPIGAFALVLLILSILAHISGNALGTRLRSCGDQPVDEQDHPLGRPERAQFAFRPASPQRLTERRRLGLVLAVIVVLMIGAGAGGGAWWTLNSEGKPATVQDIALAAAAYGVLGGIWGLIAGGFVMVGLGAWREAVRGARNPRQRLRE